MGDFLVVRTPWARFLSLRDCFTTNTVASCICLGGNMISMPRPASPSIVVCIRHQSLYSKPLFRSDSMLVFLWKIVIHSSGRLMFVSKTRRFRYATGLWNFSRPILLPWCVLVVFSPLFYRLASRRLIEIYNFNKDRSWAYVIQSRLDHNSKALRYSFKFGQMNPPWLKKNHVGNLCLFENFLLY